MADVSCSWRMVSLSGLGACCRDLFTGTPSHPVSLAVGGEFQGRRRGALLLKAYCQ